ncbi:hypothetical protein ACLOJK_022273 [Asimina triloba]
MRQQASSPVSGCIKPVQEEATSSASIPSGNSKCDQGRNPSAPYLASAALSSASVRPPRSAPIRPPQPRRWLHFTFVACQPLTICINVCLLVVGIQHPAATSAGFSAIVPAPIASRQSPSSSASVHPPLVHLPLVRPPRSSAAKNTPAAAYVGFNGSGDK